VSTEEHTPAEATRKLNGTPVTDYRIEAVAQDGRRVALEVSSVRLDGSPSEQHAT
jgi:hypothetical protein